MTEQEFMSHIIVEICDYAVRNGMEPNDTLEAIADNIKALLEISTFNNWKVKAMTDQEKREKVINKVTAIVADMQEEVDEWKDYSDSELRGGLICNCDWWYKALQTLKDAIALLKAQEAVEPKVVDTSNSKLYHNDMFKNHYCGNCGEFLHVVNRKDLFCSQCGRAVKWE